MRMTFVRHGKMAGDPFVRPGPGVNGCLCEEEGVPQAEATREALAEWRFDHAFSSPYGRALQTAEIVMRPHGVDVEVLDFLHEWMPNHDLNELPSTEAEAIRERVAGMYADEIWKTDLGEGCLEMMARVGPPFLKVLDGLGIHKRFGGYVPDAGCKDLSIIVFAHGGSLNALLRFLLGIPPFPIGIFAFQLTGVMTLLFSEARGVYYPAIECRAMHDLTE